jgi:hypothetical protein
MAVLLGSQVRKMQEQFSVTQEAVRLENVWKTKIASMLGYLPPEEIESFEGKVLPDPPQARLPKVIGSMPENRQAKPELLVELERETGKAFTQEETAVPRGQHKTEEPEIVFHSPDRNFISQDPPVSELGFPPVGTYLDTYLSFLYHPLQKRFAEVSLKAVQNGYGVIVYGAALCEEVKEENVVLTPCIFRELFPVKKGSSDTSVLEYDLTETVRKGLDLEFIPWARYAIAYTGCAAGNYRTTFQFGENESERYITLRVPYSSHEFDALTDLDIRSKNPCQGIDLFFTPETILKLLNKIQETRIAENNMGSGKSKEPSKESWDFYLRKD